MPIRGSTRPVDIHEESLSPHYRIRDPRFWVNGRVFKVLWPEPVGSTREIRSAPPTHVQSAFGQQVLTKIRWFVIVDASEHFSLCLPIMTYSNRGVAKHGTTKDTHAIIYTGQTEPMPSLGEQPRPGELGMLQSIKVLPDTRADKLQPMSRINFAKIYTVEHNVKVYAFGRVDSDSMPRLLASFKKIMGGPELAMKLNESADMVNMQESHDSQGQPRADKGKLDVDYERQTSEVPGTTEEDLAQEPSQPQQRDVTAMGEASIRYAANHYINSLRNSGNQEAQQIADRLEQSSVESQLFFLRQYTSADPG